MRRPSPSRDPAARRLLIGLPVFAIALFAIADWTIVAARKARIEAAARSASELARQNPEDRAAIAATIRAAGPGLAALEIAPPETWCECAGVRLDCSAMCAGGLDRFLRVGASLPYARISPVGPTSISGHVTLRLP